MSKAKLLAAKELINEKKYDEARTILHTVDDPVATKWLEKLDEIAPVSKKKSVKPLLFLVVGGIITGLLMIFLVAILVSNRGTQESAVAIVPTEIPPPDINQYGSANQYNRANSYFRTYTNTNSIP